MRRSTIAMLVALGAGALLPVRQAAAWRGGGFGYHAGGFAGGSSFHAAGFGGGFGSVWHGGASHWGPVTGFTHVSGTGGAGAFGYGAHGEVTHAGAGGVEHYGGSTAGTWGGAHYSSWHGYDEGAWGFHTAAAYHPWNYGSIAHYGGAYAGTAVYHGPWGGAAAVYHAPYAAGAVVRLPAGYTAVAWHGCTYYHYGYSFYHPVWVGGSVTYVPVAPPAGFFFAALPPTATTTVVSNTTYYVADGVYYQAAAQNGQTGYTVVELPVAVAAPPVVPPAGNPGPDPLPYLKALSDYLGREKHIVLQVHETYDQVAIAGQKIQMSNQRTVHLARPDKLEVNITGAGVDRSVVYNGSTFTLIDRLRNLYASMPMQGPLDTVLDRLAREYGMAQPAAELLYSDIYARLATRITSGQYLGEEKIEGKKCNVLAFAQPGVHWQMWVEQGDKPAPRKLVITYPDVPGRPQYTLLVTKWETPAVMWGSELKAKIPAGAMSASMAAFTPQAGSNP